MRTSADLVCRNNAHLLESNATALAFAPKHDGRVLLVDRLSNRNGRLEGDVCQECFQSLKQSHKPKYALANGLWIGHVPPELRDLTLPEQMLISLRYPRVYVYKMYPKDKPVAGRPELLQRGMRGNLTSFALNTEKILDMLTGNILPRPPRLLASVIAVSFIGTGKLPKRWLTETFRVRRRRVYEALCWLKAHNPMYAGFTIDEAHLQALPEDGVPIELAATLRGSDDDSAAQRERETYVPDEEGERAEDDEPEDSTTVPLSSLLDDDDDSDGGVAGTSEQNLQGEVVPIQTLGIEDTDLTNVSTRELMLFALANRRDEEGGYGVRHSRQPLSDFGVPRDGDSEGLNPLAATYPALFPYGTGGPESPGVRHLSFEEHIRWCLAYHDRRFRVHHSFIFAAFGILQRRKALMSARLQMRRRDFESVAHVLSSITVEDLRRAEEEEMRGQRISNLRVQLLRRHIFATGGRVMGSNHARAKYRGHIWGTSLYLNPVSIWITINPNDLHDPVVQVFAGEKIDMDNFEPTAGPDADRRAENIANDPYAAAKFFKTIVDALLSKVFAIDVTGFRVKSRRGILGKIKAYFGVVEAQGRGTLHLHMLMWLSGAPTSDEMRELLQREDFRLRIAEFIRANIRAHLDSLQEEDIAAMPRRSDIAYSRPPDPRKPGYEAASRELERQVVRASQVHTCKLNYCKVRTRDGGWKCKRRAPFPLAEADWVDEEGNWGVRRSYGYLNSWCPPLINVLRANHNIKLITNGGETKSVAWYITGYATKGQRKSYNSSALLARALFYHEKANDYRQDLLERNRLLV
ncbi:hypothetical protein EXIGLDRAFT_778907, partial [Exidia glandulosa HHB12029]